MRGVVEMRRRAFALACCLAAATPCALTPAFAFTIDPDPSSPTLGDMLDLENRRAKRAAPPRERPRATPAPRPADAGPALPSVPPVSAPDIAPRLAPQPAERMPNQRLGAAMPVRSPQREAFQLPADWPVLEDERSTAKPASRAPAPPISATPTLPRNAAVVHQPRAVARPKNLAVLPAQPPLPPVPEKNPSESAVIPVEAPLGLVSPTRVPLPPRREARQIALHPQAGIGEARLLRDPTVTNTAEAQTAPANLDQSIPASTPVPPARPQPKARLPAEAKPARPVAAPPPEIMPVRQALPPVALPPLEEPPRVAPRARATETPPKPVLPPLVPATSIDPDKFVYVVDQDLRQFLTDFSRRVGLRADVAATVRGRLTRVKLPLEPTALLKDLEKRFDLEWLIEGEILKVASRSDLATRILALGPVTYDDLIREMRGIDIDVSRYPLKRLSESNSVIVTAPASYIGRVSALIDTLRAGRSVGPELRIVRNGVSRKVDWE